MKNFGNYVYFLYIGNNPKYSFRTYTHPETGHEAGYVMGYDKNKQPLFKEWYFDYSGKRQIRVSTEEKDKEGTLAVDFLRNSPEFYSNPNGLYVQGSQVLAMFREINDEKDAKEAVDSRAVVIGAQAAALKLKGQELADVAAIIGVFSDSESVLVHRVLDFAANFPQKFLDLLKDPALQIKSLIKNAINANVFKVDGRVIKWEGKIIGSDEEDAVSALMKDENLKKAIKLNLEKFGKK
jgi:hypothetical protein